MFFTPLRIALAAGIVLVIAVMAFEIYQWTSGARPVTRRQKPVRIGAGLIMIALLTMIMVGDKWLAAYGPLTMLSYWLLAVALALSLVLLVLMDFKEIGKTWAEDHKQVMRDLIKQAEDRDCD